MQPSPSVNTLRPRPRKKRPGAFHHGDLREALLLAATQIVDRDGHEKLTLRALAERLGVSEPAIYRHFRGKDALLAEVGVRGLERMQQALASAADADDPFDALHAVGRAYVAFAQQHAGWFRLWFTRARTEQLGAEVARLPLDESGADKLIALVARIEPGPAKMDLFRAMWGQWHGLATLVVERVFQLVQTDEERLEAADTAIGILIDALRARSRAGVSGR